MRLLTPFVFSLMLVGMVACGGSKKVAQKEGKPLTELQREAIQGYFLDGKKEVFRGNRDQATELFQKCLAIDENHTASMYELARIAESRKQYDTALQWMKKAVRIDPENRWYQVLLAQLHENTGRYDEAAKVYEELVNTYPKKIDYLYDWANALLHQGKYEESIELLDRIETNIGVSEDISVQKYRLYLKLDRIEDAVAEINKVIKKNPTEARFYGMLAELYKSQGKNELALQTYEELLRIDPNNPYIHLSLAEYYEESGDSEKAAESIRRAFKNPDLNIDTKIQILLSYYDLSERNPNVKREAYELNELLVQTHPDDPKARSMYGDFLYRDSRLEEAREQYREAVKLDNSKFLIWRQLLFIESELQDYGAMLSESQTAMDLFPSQPLFYFFYGAAGVRKKKYEEAIEAMETGVDLVLENDALKSQFYANLGDAYNELKQYEASDKNYDLALELDPQNFYVLNNYSYFLALRGEKLEQAAQMARTCVELQPNSASYMDTYGWVLYKQGKYKEARDWLQRAVDKSGQESDVILEHLGDALYRLDDREGAMKYWKKAKEKGKGSEQLQQKIDSGELLE